MSFAILFYCIYQTDQSFNKTAGANKTDKHENNKIQHKQVDTMQIILSMILNIYRPTVWLIINTNHECNYMLMLRSSIDFCFSFFFCLNSVHICFFLSWNNNSLIHKMHKCHSRAHMTYRDTVYWVVNSIQFSHFTLFKILLLRTSFLPFQRTK